MGPGPADGGATWRDRSPGPLGARLADGLVGRRAELAEIERFLARPEDGLRGLLLSGQAGIGKTTLWKAALARARELGYRVLACRPTEVETRLSFAALVDLFADLADELLPELPEPQRVAVEAALLRAGHGAPPSPLAVSLGVLGMIRAAARPGPLLLAVDDAPWLDESSARALEFAVRRLDEVPVRLLVAQRTEDRPAGIPALVASVPEHRRSVIDVGPLSFEDTAEVVRRVLGLDLRRPDLVRLHELSAGNAFYALEIGRAIQRRANGRDGEEPAIPVSLDELIRDRIESMTATSLEVALHAAALASPTRDVLAAALGDEPVEDGLARGVAAGVLDIEGGVVRFSHPLLSAAIYGRAPADRRRAVHRRLATVVEEPEERARHLALAADAPDATIASALEAAAGAARSRGAGVAAAELAEAAVRLTPADRVRDRGRRMMTAAADHAAAGDVPRARATLERLIEETPEPERAPALVALGQLLMYLSDRPGAGRSFRAALPLVGDDLALRTRIELGLAGVAYLTWESWRDGEAHAAAALRAAEELGEPGLLSEAIGHFATWEFALGRGVRRDLMDRAAELDRARGEVPLQELPDHQFGAILSRIGETDEARRRLEPLLPEARQRGEWHALPWIHNRLTWVELNAGNWDLARNHVEDGLATAGQSGQDAVVAYIGTAEVELDALRGEVERCRASAGRYLAMAAEMGIPIVEPRVRTSLGLLELSLGNAAGAHAQLEPAVGLDFPGRDEPALVRPTVPLDVEALVGLGRLDAAEALLDGYEDLARLRDRSICIADGLRCRALLEAARLNHERALEAGGEALTMFEALGLPFEVGRTLLALAEIRRRARQKAAAREAAGFALATFERLGAARWSDRARAGIGRAEARRSRGEVLTDTERRVTELLAAGQTNREIADALFMSVHTVEAHLTRIYRTLGVRSRTELARRTIERADR